MLIMMHCTQSPISAYKLFKLSFQSKNYARSHFFCCHSSSVPPWIPYNIILVHVVQFHTGYRHWHADLRADDTPLEGGLAFTCKLSQETPFLGREALVKQKAEGLKKRIACFTIDESVDHLYFLQLVYRFVDCAEVWEHRRDPLFLLCSSHWATCL